MLGVSTAAMDRQPIGADQAFSLQVSDWPLALGPFSVQGTLSKADDGLRVAIEAHWQAEGTCDRCLGRVEVAVGGRSQALTTDLGQGETWLQVIYQEVDLTPLVEEIEILSWPAKVLCAEGCLGLCPSCGKNLNEGRCQCAETAPPGPFDQLRDLLGKDD